MLPEERNASKSLMNSLLMQDRYSVQTASTPNRRHGFVTLFMTSVHETTEGRKPWLPKSKLSNQRSMRDTVQA